VKKILFFLATSLIITIAFGCSKDNVAPSFSQFDQTKKPVNVIATYFQNKTAKTDSVRLTWDMPDTTSVTNYFISWSDSGNFDLGNVRNTYTNSLKNSFTLQATNIMKSMGYTQSPDTLSHIVYFTVSALYNNKELFDFIGPRSIAASDTIKQVF
jgi:hypothetical protein